MSQDCLFCKIVSGDIPSDKVHEDDHCVAFRDINPQAPVHVLLVPRKHIASLSDATEGDRNLLGEIALALPRLAAKLGAGSYRVVTNCGASAGQSVFHLHFHLLAGRGMTWPPG